MTLQIPFENTYASLPERFFAPLAPTPVANPGLIRINDRLAEDLGLDARALASDEGLAMLSGSALPEGAHPLAQAYAGHQFGGWVPQLGDGRAILVGEVTDRNGMRRDIQLKGSGRTPFSRMGDGRAWVGPVLREYIVSEAMHALGVPTTRALAAVTTGETVMREAPYPGAVLTRVAASHLRVGTFQYFAARRDLDAIRVLTDYAIARHYPEAEGALDLLDAVIAAQAGLIAKWMSLGFIHGVMNTDNMTISGETIDYGPCAFMESYHPDTVYSSIDQFGRYAYGKQPEIAVWNLAQLATALIPLIDDDQERAVERATESVHRFADLYQDSWLDLFRAKLGLTGTEPGDAALAHDLLGVMEKAGVDFTLTFRGLAEGQDVVRNLFSDPAPFDAWAARWSARIARSDGTEKDRANRLKAANPVIIPRNHRVEEAIQAGLQGDHSVFERLTKALETPFDDQTDNTDLQAPARPEEAVMRTFCGT